MKQNRLTAFIAALLAASVAAGQESEKPTPAEALAVDAPAAEAAHAHGHAVHHWAKRNIIDHIPVPSNPFQPDLTPGYVLIEGDIQIPFHEYLARVNGLDATYGGGGVHYWPGGVVPYDFVASGSGAVSTQNRQRAINAMNQIAARAGLHFRAATGNEDRIRFQNSNYNNSPIGWRGGAQIINIFNWETEIVIVHEVYHSLGYWHEQSRLDRNAYVTIHYNNICGSNTSNSCIAGGGTGQCCWCLNWLGWCDSCAHNFDLVNAPYWGPYDFESMMHYGSHGFSCNGQPTITINPPWNALYQIGQRERFSYMDEMSLRGLYPYIGDRWIDRTWNGNQFGTFHEPWAHPFLVSYNTAPSNGTIFIKTPGNYSAVGIYSKPMTIRSPIGVTTLGN
jgi:hypothetical protein